MVRILPPLPRNPQAIHFCRYLTYSAGWVQTVLTRTHGPLERASNCRTSRGACGVCTEFQESFSLPLPPGSSPGDSDLYLAVLISLKGAGQAMEEESKIIMTIQMSASWGIPARGCYKERHFPLLTVAHPFLLSHSVSGSVGGEGTMAVTTGGCSSHASAPSCLFQTKYLVVCSATVFFSEGVLCYAVRYFCHDTFPCLERHSFLCRNAHRMGNVLSEFHFHCGLLRL